MRSPAAAFAWEFRYRHRWGFAALGAYLLLLTLLRIFEGQFEFKTTESFAFAIVVPLTATFIYFLAVFTFGISGDLAARQSIYPPRLFTLPVTSSALAGWPMLYGSIATALLWFATRIVGVWPARSHVPVVWPALLAASLLAWTQALTWMPYGLPALRVIVTVLWLATIDAIVMIAMNLNASEPVMLAILAPHVPIAYLVARHAVARARRGDVPDWRVGWFRERRAGASFASAARAQAWFEWRQHGRSLPMLVAIVLPCELALMFLFRGTPELVLEIFLIMLTTPPFMAIFVAATVSFGVTPFLTAKPISDASLIASKLKSTLRSALVAWVLVGVATAIASPLLIGRWQTLTEILGTARAAALLVFGIAALIGTTWKQLVQSLFIGTSGRPWLVKASVFAPLAVIGIVVPIVGWMLERHSIVSILWTTFPAIAAVIVCLKLVAAGWIAMRLRAKRIVSDRVLLAGAAAWDGAVFLTFGVLAWCTPDVVVSRYILALIAILAVPLARVSAAPLALAWSRHR